MPILLYALAGLGVVSSGFLVIGSGVKETTDAAGDGLTKLLIPAIGALGVYAAFKVLSK